MSASLGKLDTAAAYVDGFLLAVPTHGGRGEEGKWTSFPRAVKLKKGEVVFFSYITYKSKASRNRAHDLGRIQAGGEVFLTLK